MAHTRTHISISSQLLKDIDSLAGPRGRSAFIEEAVREEVKRRRLIKLLRSPEPLVSPAAYSHWEDSAAWVRKQRRIVSNREKRHAVKAVGKR